MRQGEAAWGNFIPIASEELSSRLLCLSLDLDPYNPGSSLVHNSVQFREVYLYFWAYYISSTSLFYLVCDCCFRTEWRPQSTNLGSEHSEMLPHDFPNMLGCGDPWETPHQHCNSEQKRWPSTNGKCTPGPQPFSSSSPLPRRQYWDCSRAYSRIRIKAHYLLA